MKRLTETLNSIEPASAEFREQATRRIESLTMPHWALGRLLDLAVDLAGMTRSLEFPVARKTVVLMAGDHGIVAEGVTPQPSSVTVQMVHNFVAGGAGINAVARSTGTRVVVADLGVAADLSDLVSAGKIFDCKVAPGTCNFAKGPAMTRLQAVASLEAGIGLARRLAPETDVFGSGEMGIGNTSPSSAIVAVLSRQDPGPLVGPGAALPQSRLAHKAEVIRRGIALNQPDPADGVDVLAKVGGFEIGGIAGLALGAAAQADDGGRLHFKRRRPDRRRDLPGRQGLPDPRPRQLRAGAPHDGTAARQKAAARPRPAPRRRLRRGAGDAASGRRPRSTHRHGHL